MRLFYRKILRDLMAMRAQCGAITVAVFLGVSLYLSSWQSYRNLYSSYDFSYRTLKFADFTISSGPAPDSLVSEIRSLPGVEAAVGRIVRDVMIEQPYARPFRGAKQFMMFEPTGHIPRLTGRFISLPAHGRAAVNDVQVIRGRYLAPGARREALLERSFAEYHGYRLGDTLRVKANGTPHQFRVVGIVISPEYLYAIRSKEYLVPTPENFGVVFVSREETEDLFGLSGEITEVCARTSSGRRARAMRIAHSLMEPYGAEVPVPREQQPSNNLLSTDLRGFSQVAVIFPALFLTAAALTIYTVLSRLVRTQQRQIGYLRASGLDGRSVCIYYLLLAGGIGVAGSVPGVISGLGLSVVVTRMYLKSLHIPNLVPSSPWTSIAVGTSIGILACLLAAWRPAVYAARLHPATAMRGEAVFLGPSMGLLWLVRGLRGLRTILRLPLRNLFRHRLRTLYTAAGVAIGVALILVSLGLKDSSIAAVNLYFHQIRGYDIGVGFARPRTEAAVSQLARIPGVVRAEGYANVPVRLEGPAGATNTTIYALFPWTKTVHLVTREGEPIRQLGRGLYISETVRKTLGIAPGGLLRVAHARSSRRQRIEAYFPVDAIIRHPVGSAVYMRADVLMNYFAPRLGLSPGSIDGVLLIVRPGWSKAVMRRAYDIPGVVGVENVVDIRSAVDQMMALTYALTAVMTAFGLGLALAIIYNAVTINLYERRAEIASMRAQGVTMREVSWIVTIENLLGTVLGILPGLPLGRLLDAYMIRAYETETLNMPLVITPQTYLFAILSVIVMALLSQAPGLRAIRRMDLAAMARAQSE